VAARYRAESTPEKRDPKVAFAEHKGFCDRGEACGMLAADYAEGAGVARDQARATALYKKDCDECRGFFWPSCAALADRYAAGLGTLRRARRAAELYENVCPQGMFGACLPLADMIRAGDGAPRDEAHAHDIEGRAADGFDNCCTENGDSACCQRAAQMKREGRNGEADEIRAQTLELRAALRAEAACRKGEAAECHDLAQRHVLGRGVAEDATCAERLFARACAGGYAPACKPVRWTAPPTEQELAAAPEVIVKHSTALGCETRLMRSWLRVRCAPGAGIEAPVDTRIVRGGRDLESAAFRGGGQTILLTTVREGDEIDARVVWPKTGIRTLRITWPRGAAAATMGFDRGR
jgi:TPR repeat protein